MQLLLALLVLSAIFDAALATSRDPSPFETAPRVEFSKVSTLQSTLVHSPVHQPPAARRRRRRLKKDEMSIDEEDYYMVDPPPRPRTPVKSGPIKYVDPALERPRIPHRRSKRRHHNKAGGYSGGGSDSHPPPEPSSTPPPTCPPVVCKSWPSSSSQP